MTLTACGETSLKAEIQIDDMYDQGYIYCNDLTEHSCADEKVDGNIGTSIFKTALCFSSENAATEGEDKRRGYHMLLTINSATHKFLPQQFIQQLSPRR